MVALVLVLGGGISGMLIGCGEEETAVTTAASEEITTSTPGGELTVVVYGSENPPYQTLDPSLETLVNSSHNQVYEPLLRQDMNGEFIPLLAESWDMSEDGLVWTFHLRQGVKFQDGTTLDSQAVKVSIEHNMQGANGNLYDAFVSVDTPDANTIVFTLDRPYPVLEMLACGYCTHVYSPTALEKYGDQAFEPGNGAGTGPYRLIYATPIECRYERFEDYWGGWEGTHANAPEAAAIRQIIEPSVRLQNLQQGECHVVSSVAPTDLERVSQDSSLTVWETASPTVLGVSFNTQKEPLTDLNLRAACSWAYPYEQAVEMVALGYGAVSRGPFTQGMHGRELQNELFPQRQQDMAKAREYLAKSAYPDGGVTLLCTVDNATDLAAKSMELWRAALADLNITLEVQPTPAPVMWEQMTSENPPQDIRVQFFYGAFGNGLNALEYEVCSWSPVNTSYLAIPELDQLILDAYGHMATEPEQGVRDTLEAWQIYVDDNYAMFHGMDLNFVAVASTKLKGFQGFSLFDPYVVNFYDVWFEN